MSHDRKRFEIKVTKLKVGFYWVRFTFGWEPARWDGEEWLRCGIERSWNSDMIEVGDSITRNE